MSKASLDVDAWLARLNCSGPRTPDAETLRALHRAHLYAVPFENLDIPLGRLSSLDHDALFQKIATRRRGGFCYELNGLFARLLSVISMTHFPPASWYSRAVGANLIQMQINS